MSRTILYYPSIAIRNPRWIRQMILYWDAIGTIAPQDLREEAYASADIQRLRAAGMFQTFHPETPVSNAEDLTEEFIAIHKKVNFPRIDPEKLDLRRDGYSVYRKKMPEGLREYLLEEKLAKYSREERWMEMDRSTGLLYMSLLAKYLANEESFGDRVVTPGTDYGACADVILKTLSSTEALPGLSFTLNQALPYPREDIDIDVILEFRKTRETELLGLRDKIYKFQDAIKKEVRDESDLSEYALRFSEEISREVKKIHQEAEKAKIAMERGTIETILAAGDTPLVKALEKVLPPPIPVIVQITAGIFSIRSYRLSQSNAIQQKLIENSFSFVYHAQQEGII